MEQGYFKETSKSIHHVLSFSQLPSICEGKLLQLSHERSVQTLLIDSRKSMVSEGSVFFAIAGARHDGHLHLRELYQSGIRQFVVEKSIDLAEFPDANVVLVSSSISALQKIAENHRLQFSIRVIGITGSNAKTIIKEWLYQLLSADLRVVKNPGSYNSQLGVPLSVWQMQAIHQLGIFEAGISQVHEMQNLAAVIRPTIGIFTNIGTAHDEGFPSRTEKIKEKLRLFENVKALIYCIDHQAIHQQVKQTSIQTFTWGEGEGADIKINRKGQQVNVWFHESEWTIDLPFSDMASVENAMHCVATMLYLGYKPSIIQQRLLQLKPIAMRLELKQGINHCQIIDDTYNNDLAGLRISLDFLLGQQKKKKTLILSDILQSGLDKKQLVKNIAELIDRSSITRFIGIGPVLASSGGLFRTPSTFFVTTNDFVQSRIWENFEGELILLKGARHFQFEKIVNVLQRKTHGTVMEIDLNKMVNNLNFFKSKLKPGVKIMAMVKAFAYGSGSEEVANLLQYHQVNYLGVAYADEGIELRRNNISLPIMIMNPAEESFTAILDYQLEPVMFNLKMLVAFLQFVEERSATIHLEVDTGMHRLGFDVDDIEEIVKQLKSRPNVKIASVFSHLAGADELMHDQFSLEQFNSYQKFYEAISTLLKVQPLRHILNSPGILRLKDFQMDMVRLGIGLYGVNPTEEKFDELQPVATLKTIVSQIKHIKKGETIGYGRKGVASEDMQLATIAIGYADGFSRGFSNGKGVVLVKGKRAPVVGNVCMDMTMVDVTGMGAKEGDEVIIFGDGLPIHEVAVRLGTIPYEILTNTSERVKRVFFAEGI